MIIIIIISVSRILKMMIRLLDEVCLVLGGACSNCNISLQRGSIERLLLAVRLWLLLLGVSWWGLLTLSYCLMLCCVVCLGRLINYWAERKEEGEERRGVWREERKRQRKREKGPCEMRGLGMSGAIRAEVMRLELEAEIWADGQPKSNQLLQKCLLPDALIIIIIITVIIFRHQTKSGTEYQETIR